MNESEFSEKNDIQPLHCLGVKVEMRKILKKISENLSPDAT